MADVPAAPPAGTSAPTLPSPVPDPPLPAIRPNPLLPKSPRKLKRPMLEPPGKRIRCIVSVGMLTEGWDCNTVTHIVGLRPFMSQLLCEQVVGRALRRASYAVEENGLLSEEIAQEVQLKAGLASNTGRPSLFGPGKLQDVNLKTYRDGRRLQELEFDLARELARTTREQTAGQLAPSEVFGPCLMAVKQFIATRVTTLGAADQKDAFLSPYYGIMLERLATAMSVGEQEGAELPKLETNRPPGTTADVDFVSRREPVPVMKSHVNAVVADTAKWEQQAAYFIDAHPRVVVFVKNAGLGLGVPYTHEGQRHDYVPDFLIRRDDGLNIVLETKGFDRLADTKQQAAHRWVAAVNAHGGFGKWTYRLVRDPNAVRDAISMAN